MGFENSELVFAIADVVAFFLAVFFAACFLGGWMLGPENIKPLKFDDKFDIGYIRDDKPSTLETSDNTKYYASISAEIKPKKKTKPKTKPKAIAETKPKPKPKPQLVNPIVDDCISTLESLGEKRSSARRIVNQYLQKHPKTQTVEEFISGVFKK